MASKRVKTAELVEKAIFARTPLVRRVLEPGASTTRLMCWNVNGLKSVVDKHLDAFTSTIAKSNPDVIFLQETKLQDGGTAQYANLLKEHSYEAKMFSCSTAKKGYSGVAIYAKPDVEILRLSKPDFLNDGEGRTITVEFPKYYFVGCYVANAGQTLDRLEYRTARYDEAVRDYLALLSETKPVVFGGDLNVAHRELDVYNYSAAHLKKQAGCTKEERESFDRTLAAGNRVDSFRFLHPEASGHFTFWSTRAGNKPFNRGMRLDYFVVPLEMMSETSEVYLVDSWCEEDAPAGVSDHGPILCDIRA